MTKTVFWSKAKIVFGAVILLGVVAICLVKISQWQETISANDEAISAFSEEAASLKEEIAEYDYKTSMSKKDFVEQEARNRGYVYENETAYYNDTPGK